MSSSPDLTARFVDAALLTRAERTSRAARAQQRRSTLAGLRRRLGTGEVASAAPATPRGIASLDLDVTGRRLRRAGSTHALPPSRCIDAAASVRVLSYNVGMLPFFALPGRELRRASAICDAILALDPAVDIICLQELFSKRLRPRFAEKLGARYPHMVTRCGEELTLNLDSGLFIASRYPLRSTPLYEHFTQSTSWDALSDKGVLAVLVEPPVGPPLVICNTHLQSDYGRVGENAEVRQDQLSQVARVVRHAVRRAARQLGDEVGALLVGDFNVVGELGGAPTAEYRAVRHLLGEPVDLYRALHDDSGHTWDPSGNSAIPNGRGEPLRVAQRLDYGFAFNGPHTRALLPQQAEVLPFVDASGANLSDHYAVRFEVAPTL